MGVLAAFLNALLLVILSGGLAVGKLPAPVEPGACVGRNHAVGRRARHSGESRDCLEHRRVTVTMGTITTSISARRGFTRWATRPVASASSSGAVIIHYTGWLKIDPILSIVISLVIVWTAWDIFKDSLNILLEGLPKGLRLTEVTTGIRGVSGVIDVHDLHIWNLGAEERALSCHVLIEDVPPSASESILRDVNCVLQDRFGIHHTTIQFEHTRCALADISCAPGRKAY